MAEWKKTTLEKCTDILGDGLHGTPKYTEGGEYAFINGNNLVNGEILIKKDTKRVDYSQYEKYKKPLTNRTLLVSINGTLGNVGMYNSEKIILGKSACYFNVKEFVDKDFIYYVVSSPIFRQYLEHSATGTTIKNISLKQMREYDFLLPPIEEQKQISSVLKMIDEKIKNNRRVNDNLVAVGTASLQKNVGRGALINLTEAEMDRLTLPDGFEIQTISEFCRETKSGSTPSRTNNEYWENGTISWVKSGEVHNNITLQTEEYITPLGLSESSTKLLPKDTVLMAMYGVTAGEVGYLAIEATTNQAICGMICNSKADAAYLYFSLIQSQAAISRLSNGGAQDNLSKNFIDNIKIVVPPSEFIENLNLAAIIEQMTLNTKEIALLEEVQATALAQLSSY